MRNLKTDLKSGEPRQTPQIPLKQYEEMLKSYNPLNQIRLLRMNLRGQRIDKGNFLRTSGLFFVLAFAGISWFTRDSIKRLKNSDYAEYLADCEARKLHNEQQDQQLQR